MALPLSEPALFGAVQGLTEFLPVSSSGHLLLLHSITHFSTGDDLTFDVALHLGTLAALVIYFWRDIGCLLKAWVRSFSHLHTMADPMERLAWYIIVASIPGALFGALLEAKFEDLVRSPGVVAGTIIFGGLSLWAADRWSRREFDLDHLSWGKSFWIGLGQAAALIPGISRSGATIIVARLFGLTRSAAARFSFLMGIPIIAGAAAKKMLDLRHVTLTTDQMIAFTVGVLTAAVVGYLAIRVLLRYISTHSYAIFAWYRLALGAAVILWLSFR